MQPGGSKKREAESNRDHSANPSGHKRIKSTKKKWIVPKKSFKQDSSANAPSGSKFIEPGDAGIWVTCDMHKEARCVGELRTLFEEHANHLYELTTTEKQNSEAVEDDIAEELAQLRNEKSKLFRSVRLDTQCILFFKTTPPVEPVNFVLSFCEDAAKPSQRRRIQAVRRLTPVSLIGIASEKGIEKVAQQVLAPHFHDDNQETRKFAIRITIRNHNILKRNQVIDQVADIVGPKHKVDLDNPDLLILVEIYKNICGISVVGKEYERLKRFNLFEIYEQNNPSKSTDS